MSMSIMFVSQQFDLQTTVKHAYKDLQFRLFIQSDSFLELNLCLNEKATLRV
jgi:hypothetical protein